MKSSRFQFEYRATASKRHRQVGEIFRSHPYFINYISYQEYPVNKVDPNYLSGREHFDWVVPQLKLVCEVHGEQHYGPTCFGGISQQEAVDAFNALRIRDRAKENAAVSAGWTYISISPDIVITAEWIIDQYQQCFNPAKPVLIKRVSIHTEEYNEKKKTKAAQWRKEQYQKQKAWKKKNV